MTRNLTCIVCPRGCQLQVTLENGVIGEVTGFTCPRGKKYAIDECTHPMRTVTSTARTVDGRVIPVKTAGVVPKELMTDVMKELNGVKVAVPARIGDVVIENILGTGTDVVVTANMD